MAFPLTLLEKTQTVHVPVKHVRTRNKSVGTRKRCISIKITFKTIYDNQTGKSVYRFIHVVLIKCEMSKRVYMCVLIV